MNKKIIYIVIVSLFIFGCSKQDFDNSNTSKDVEVTKSNDNESLVYIHNGVVVNRDAVNWNSETLNIVTGFTLKNEILLFDDDDALRKWAEKIVGGDFFINTLDNVAKALKMAEKMGEFERLEETGKVSDEYSNYLQSLTNHSSKGATKLFKDTHYSGGSMWVWVPDAYVGSSFNNRTSSIQFGSIGGYLANYRWWGGSKMWYAGVAGGSHPSLASFDNKTTSVWIY